MENQRLATLAKIEKDDERTKEILEAKRDLLHQRKVNQMNTMKQKHEIHEAMEKLRVTNSFGNFQKTMKSMGLTKRNSMLSSGSARSLPNLANTN